MLLESWEDAIGDPDFEDEVARALTNWGDASDRKRDFASSCAEDLQLVAELEASSFHVGLAEHGEWDGEISEPFQSSGGARDEGVCKSCGCEILGVRRDFCSYGCTKRAAFIGLPLTFPRSEEPSFRLHRAHL